MNETYTVPAAVVNRPKAFRYRGAATHSAIDDVSLSKALTAHCCAKKCLQHVSFIMIRDKRRANLGSYSKSPSGMKGTRPERRKDRDETLQPHVDFKSKRTFIWNLLLELHEANNGWAVTVAPPLGGEPIPLCIQAWALYNGFAPSTVRRFKQCMSQGIKNIVHRPASLKKSLGGGSLAGDDVKKELIIAWLQKEANNKVGMGADVMPMSNGWVHLPLFSKKWAFIEYCKAMQLQDPDLPSYSYFTSVWRTSKELFKIKTQRKVGTLARCSTCTRLGDMLKAMRGTDMTRLAEIEAEFRGHIFLQQFERKAYAYKQMLAASEPHLYLSCIIDSSTQFCYQCPYVRDNFKGLAPTNNLPQSLTAVYYHGKGRGTHIYPSSSYVFGGSNWTIQCLMKSLVSEAANAKAKNSALPRTWFVQMDNAVGDNKNKFVFGFFSTMVVKGIFDTIVVSFLLVGHTHEDIDQLFSQLAAHLKSIGVHLSLEELDELLRSLHAELDRQNQKDITVTRLRATGDYKEFMGPFIPKEISGHTRPRCFVFDVDVNKGVRSCKMRYREFSVSDTWFPLPVLRNGTIHPNDVYAERLLQENQHMTVVDEEHSKSLEKNLNLSVERKADEMIMRYAELRKQKGGVPGREEPAVSAATAIAAIAQTVHPEKNKEVYISTGFLKHESDASRKSYHDSPGLTFATSNVPDLSQIKCAPVHITEADELRFRQGCSLYLTSYAKVVTSFPPLRISNAKTAWEQFFSDWPHSEADIRPEEYQIDWDCLLAHRSETDARDRAPVVKATALELMKTAAGGDLDFRGVEPIDYAERYSRDERQRAFEEVAALAEEAPVAIQRNQFIICLRDKNDTALVGAGFTAEEETLPFYLAKAKTSAPEGSPPSTKIEIAYWRQPEGNPNLAFIAGIAAPADTGGPVKKVWTGVVERNSILIAEPTFKPLPGRNKVLDEGTRMMLAELNHPQLQGWVYDKAEHVLVRREAITEVEVGDFFLVSWKTAPAAVRKSALKEQLPIAGVLVVQAKVPVSSAAVLAAGSVEGVTWYRFAKDDLNAKFVFLVIPGDPEAPKKRSTAQHAVVSSVLVTDLLMRISPDEGVKQKLCFDTKRKLIAGKFQTLQNWSIVKKKLVYTP